MMETIETVADYDKAMARYEEVKYASKGSQEHKEKMLLVTLIEQYERQKWDFPKLDPIELIKVRMEDFGYNKL